MAGRPGGARWPGIRRAEGFIAERGLCYLVTLVG